MKTLPNGVVVFNATPHVIRFWREAWTDPVEVEPDQVIDARPIGRIVEERPIGEERIFIVTTEFVGDDKGEEIARAALAAGADVVVGSTIAAMAYPGLVVAMTPAPGYERVAPAEKRMRPDKFVTYTTDTTE